MWMKKGCCGLVDLRTQTMVIAGLYTVSWNPITYLVYVPIFFFRGNFIFFKPVQFSFVQSCPIFFFCSTFSFVLSYFHFCPIFNFVNTYVQVIVVRGRFKKLLIFVHPFSHKFHTFEKWGKYFWWFSASCIDWNDLWIRHDSKSRKNF